MGGGKVEAKHTSLHQQALRRFRAEMRSHFLGVLPGWRICSFSLLSLSSKEVYFETFYPFPAGEMKASVMEGRRTARGA